MRTGWLLGRASLAAIALAAPAAAQQAPDNGTVGPAQIRDFSLPGARPAEPREPEPKVAPVETPKAEPTPAPAPAEPGPSPAQAPAPAPAAERPDQREAGRRREQPRDPPVVQSAPADLIERLREPEQPAPLPAPSAPTGEAPIAPAAPATEQRSPRVSEPAPVGEESGLPWLWLVAGLAVAGGAFAYARRQRQQASEPAQEPELLLDVVAEPKEKVPTPAKPAMAPAAPAPMPPDLAPAPTGSVGIVMRPWLEIDFRPERAVATETGAEVRYEVTIRNTGNAPARNVRLAAKMFTAGPELDREIATFFGRGVDDRGAAPLTILPRSDISFQSVVSLPREEVKEIRIEGRSLFVPTVAFNLLYEYGRGKTGQTCTSHVVGREAETPAAKMGPFRLDLGPRVWRSVGQRPSALARAV